MCKASSFAYKSLSCVHTFAAFKCGGRHVLFGKGGSIEPVFGRVIGTAYNTTLVRVRYLHDSPATLL